MHRRPRFLPLVPGTMTALSPLSIDLCLRAPPSMQRALNTTASSTQLSVAASFIGVRVTQLFYGPSADRSGRRVPLLGGVTRYERTSVGCVLPFRWPAAPGRRRRC